MNNIRTLGMILVLSALAGGCGVIGNQVLGSSVPAQGSLIPDTKVQVSPSYATSLEKIAVTAAAAAALYYIYQPLDPNWEGANLQVSHEVYRIALRKKRFHIGGDGEALQVTRRYAEQLRLARGASGYTIVEFAQGIESSTPFARGNAEAIVRLQDIPAPAPAEIEGPPAAAANPPGALTVATAR